MPSGALGPEVGSQTGGGGDSTHTDATASPPPTPCADAAHREAAVCDSHIRLSHPAFAAGGSDDPRELIGRFERILDERLARKPKNPPKHAASEPAAGKSRRASVSIPALTRPSVFRCFSLQLHPITRISLQLHPTTRMLSRRCALIGASRSRSRSLRVPPSRPPSDSTSPPPFTPASCFHSTMRSSTRRTPTRRTRL